MALDPEKIQVARPISLLDEQEAERLYEEERAKVTFGQAADAAFSEENTMAWIFNGLEDFEPDPDFRLTEENLAELTKDIPEDRQDFIVEAVSMPHAMKLRERALESLKNQETLAKYGWGGVGLQIAAATLDVPAIAATVATEGAAAPMIWGAKAGRIGRVFRNATTSAASAAAIESYLVSQNSMKDPYDILYAAGGGFLLGGALDSVFGAVSSRRYKNATKKIMNDVEQAQAADVNRAMQDRGIDTGIPVMGERDFVPLNIQDEIIQGAKVSEPITADEMIDRQGMINPSWFMTADGKLFDAGDDHLNFLDKFGLEGDYAVRNRGLIRTQGLFLEGTPPNQSLRFGMEFVDGQVITSAQLRSIRKLVRNAESVYVDVTDSYNGSVKQTFTESKEFLAYLRELETFNPVEANFRNIGAMENPMSRPTQDIEIRRNIVERIDEADAEPMADFGRVRFDIVGQLKNSKISLSRRAASMLGEDAVNPGEITADLMKTVDTKRMSDRFYRQYEKSYENWAKGSGINFVARRTDSRRSEFGRLVSDEIEMPGSSTNPDIINAANNVRGIFSEMLQDAKRAGVKGFDDIPENPSYFTHMWDGHRFLKYEAEFGEDIPGLLKMSLVNANPRMPEEAAEAIANGMTKKIMKREVGIDSGLARMFSTSNKEALRDILLEEEILSEDQVDRIIGQLDFDREGVAPRAKRRLNFDMSASVERNGKTLHIKDLMERDTEAVVNAYINQMQGRIALAKKGIFSDGDFESLKKDIMAAGREIGDTPQAERDIQKLDVLYALISGRPSPLIGSPGSDANRIARLLMDYNFLRVMNQVGFAQISELGNAVSIDGTMALLRVVPDFKAMIKRAANGELEDGVVRDLEAFAGIGVDRNIQQAMNRYSVEDLYSLGKGDTIDKAISFIQPLRRATADISGLAPITTILERSAGKIATQSLVDLASGIKKVRMKKLGKTTLEQDIAKRLASLGLDEAMWPRVVNQINKHTKTHPSIFSSSRKVKDINMGDWDDIEARDALRYGLARWTRQSIQQNDAGNLNIHMTSTMGKILTQFRTFMLVSHSKQFLHNIKRNDFAAYSAMMWSCLYGGAAYTLQTHVNAIGRDDKEEFLRERLSAEEIGKAAFQRSSWAALLPGSWDTLMWATGQEPVFAYKRTTGLATSFIAGNPVFDLLDTAGKVARGGTRAAFNEEYQWSRGQQRALNSLLPFQNAIGIKNVLNTMVEGLPEQARIQD